MDDWIAIEIQFSEIQNAKRQKPLYNKLDFLDFFEFLHFWWIFEGISQANSNLRLT